MNKNIVLCSLPLAVLGINSATAKVKNEKRPNIILFYVDDMGWKDVGYNGSDYYETPNIDRIAAQSLVFNNSYAMGPNSAPSRACLISGQFTPGHGVYAVVSTTRGPKDQMKLIPYPNRENLAPSIQTLGESMQKAGYATGMVGKWHLGSAPEDHPSKRGFDYAYEFHMLPNEQFVKDNDPKSIFKQEKLAHQFIRESMENEKPFFLYLPLLAVHVPWQAQKPYLDYFKNKPKGQYHYRPLFAAMVKHTDDFFGRIIEYLKETGIYENTIVVFASDNGGTHESSQHPLRCYKGTYYEGGIKVPTFVHWGSRLHGISDEIICNVDFYPTFLDIAGAMNVAPKELDGETLLPLIEGHSQKLKRESIFWHFPGYLDSSYEGSRDTIFRTRPVSTIRKGDWKLLMYHEEWLLNGGWDKRDTNNSIELYNVMEDINESQNLASVNPQKRDELLKELLQWLQQKNAPMPTVK